jgi:hypothetical protein
MEAMTMVATHFQQRDIRMLPVALLSTRYPIAADAELEHKASTDRQERRILKRPFLSETHMPFWKKHLFDC